MSETVKLIIEIPKPMYESIQNGTYCGTLYEELKNGIPLDDVKEPKNGERFSCPNCGFKADWFIPSKEDNTKESK